MIDEIDLMIKNIMISPELFSDGIDEEILELLLKIKKHLEKGSEKNERNRNNSRISNE